MWGGALSVGFQGECTMHAWLWRSWLREVGGVAYASAFPGGPVVGIAGDCGTFPASFFFWPFSMSFSSYVASMAYKFSLGQRTIFLHSHLLLLDAVNLDGGVAHRDCTRNMVLRQNAHARLQGPDRLLILPEERGLALGLRVRPV